MRAVYENSIAASLSPSRSQIACTDDFIALPHAHSTIALWNLRNLKDKPTILEGHRSSVQAVAFNDQRIPTWLSSAATNDFIIIWNMDHVISSPQNQTKQVHGRLVCSVPTGTSTARCLAFSPDDTLLALAADKLVHIVDIKGSKVKVTLEGHDANVNCVEFCPHYTLTVVSVSDDRTFKVWGISSASLLYQSAIISASPFISLSMNPLQESFAVGTADGIIRVYDLADGHDFRCIQQIDIGKVLQKLKQLKSGCSSDKTQTEDETVVISSKSRVERIDTQALGQGDTIANEAEVACNVVGLSYIYTPSSGDLLPDDQLHGPRLLSHNKEHDEVVSDLLFASTPMLYVATTGAVLQMEASTFRVVDHVNLQESISSTDEYGNTFSKSLSLTGGAAFAQSFSQRRKIWCTMSKLFRKEVDIISFHQNTSVANSSNRLPVVLSSLSPSASKDSVAEEWWQDLDLDCSEAIPSSLSVMSSAPLVPNSPLRSELKLKVPSQNTKSSGVRPTKAAIPGSVDKKGNIVDRQPVTVHAKIKSSGYSQTTQNPSMFQPRTKLAAKQSKSLSALNGGSGVVLKEYPVTSQPPVISQGVLNVAERSTAVNCLHFTEKGDKLVCALSNCTAAVFTCPLKSTSYKDQLALADHRFPVNCAKWSQDGRWLITSSDDKTAKIWSSGALDPVMTLATVNQNLSSGKDDPTNVAFSKPICSGQFYYIDRFILMSSANAFFLYKYHLELLKSDIQRYKSNNKYKLVQKFAMENCHTITAMSAINSFHSYIVLCAGSDKSVQVYDMNVGANVSTLDDVHTRSVHCIAQNSRLLHLPNEQSPLYTVGNLQGSMYTSQANFAYDLFLTCAVSDGIKLWDLRSKRCVRAYNGHMNRAHLCTAAFSPCCRYIATGSEDKSAYIYDIRSGSYLHKLAGHTDTVTNVAFHNRYPQLLTATLDGKLSWFTGDDCKL